MERGETSDLPRIDLILSCGDLPPEYLVSLVNVFEVPLYYVRGNHDIRHATGQFAGCENLDRRLVRFKGLNILGLEGSRWYNGGPVQYTENQMKKRIRGLRLSIWWRKGIDIIITHAPPRHIHDAEDLCHRGFRSFRNLIDRYQPSYFIHGHIHAHFENAQERMTKIQRTRVVNTYGYHLIEVRDE
jgi:Icc-related predicted phosphoesterase